MINLIWNKIIEYQGEVFSTSTDKEFTHEVNDNRVSINRNGHLINRLITKLDFEKAINYNGNSSREFNNLVNGPSYVKAILSDDRISVSEQFINFNCCGIKFTRAGIIKPVLNENGIINTYTAYNIRNTYLNNPNYELMDLPNMFPLITTRPNEIIGNKEFCIIDISLLNLPNRSGVYLWVINNIVVYIGRAVNNRNESLLNRFKNGYSKINCRPCWKKIYPDVKRGQSTNMKMNLLVKNCAIQNIDLELYYFETNDAANLETQLLRSNWVYRDPIRISTCVYNARR